MPIVVQHQPSAQAIGQAAHLGGLGSYRRFAEQLGLEQQMQTQRLQSAAGLQRERVAAQFATDELSRRFRGEQADLGRQADTALQTQRIDAEMVRLQSTHDFQKQQLQEQLGSRQDLAEFQVQAEMTRLDQQQSFEREKMTEDLRQQQVLLESKTVSQERLAAQSFQHEGSLQTQRLDASMSELGARGNIQGQLAAQQGAIQSGLTAQRGANQQQAIAMQQGFQTQRAVMLQGMQQDSQIQRFQHQERLRQFSANQDLERLKMGPQLAAERTLAVQNAQTQRIDGQIAALDQSLQRGDIDQTQYDYESNRLARSKQRIQNQVQQPPERYLMEDFGDGRIGYYDERGVPTIVDDGLAGVQAEQARLQTEMAKERLEVLRSKQKPEEDHMAVLNYWRGLLKDVQSGLMTPQEAIRIAKQGPFNQTLGGFQFREPPSFGGTDTFGQLGISPAASSAGPPTQQSATGPSAQQTLVPSVTHTISSANEFQALNPGQDYIWGPTGSSFTKPL